MLARMTGPLTVRDVMTDSVVFLHANSTVEDAARTLTRHRIHGAPVLGRGGRIVGMVAMTDLLPHDGAEAPNTVEEAMTKVALGVRADDPAMAAVAIMVRERVHRAVVVNDDGTLAGIVAPMDILQALDEGRPVQTSVGTFDFVQLSAVVRTS